MKQKTLIVAIASISGVLYGPIALALPTYYPMDVDVSPIENTVAAIDPETITYYPFIDTDGDYVEDDEDAFPYDPNEWLDSDGDGKGNNADPDDDNDGLSDKRELLFGLDPLNPNDAATADLDGDGLGNHIDTDDDGDGMPDVWEKKYGLNAWNDNDADTDLDNDFVSNLTEYRNQSNPKQPDTDGDGINDAQDSTVGNGMWGYACNVMHTPFSTNKWGINQYDISSQPSEAYTPLLSIAKNRKIQSVSCDPRGNSIVYSVKESQTGDYEIYELDLASKLTTQLTVNGTDDVDVTRSHDGQVIAWQMRLEDGRQAIELRHMKQNGGYVSKTLASASPFVQPSLSPNGKWLTFVQLRPSFFVVMRYDITNQTYSTIRSIPRRKKLYHPSVSNDGNLIGWTENTSQNRYRVKNLAQDTLVDVIKDASGVEHAVLSGDGQYVIYSINADESRKTLMTNLSTLETTQIGKSLADPDRYLATNWQAVTLDQTLSPSVFTNRVLVNMTKQIAYSFSANGTGKAYSVSETSAREFSWSLDSDTNTLYLTDNVTSEQTVMRLLSDLENRYTFSVVGPDGSGGSAHSEEVLFRGLSLGLGTFNELIISADTTAEPNCTKRTVRFTQEKAFLRESCDTGFNAKTATLSKSSRTNELLLNGVDLNGNDVGTVGVSLIDGDTTGGILVVLNESPTDGTSPISFVDFLKTGKEVKP